MIVGGTTPVKIVLAINTASIPPAAPNPCPVAPLVEETKSSLALSPNTVFIAIVSFLSFAGVDVPCAFI